MTYLSQFDGCPIHKREYSADCHICNLRKTDSRYRELLDGSTLEWISTRQLALDTIQLLLPKLPPSITAIAGVARSGMIPASILATHLHLPLYVVDQFEPKPVPIPCGLRGKEVPFNEVSHMAIVDDTVYGGNAMRSIRGKLGNNYHYSSVYVRPEMEKIVDTFARLLLPPHILEWNLFNSGLTVGKVASSNMQGGLATDFDGILCTDNDPLKPLYLARRSPIPAIITGRSEASKPDTEAFMTKWGIVAERIYFRPSEVADDWESIATFKSKIYTESGFSLYVESCPKQAEKIWQLSGKPVLCPIAERIFQGQPTTEPARKRLLSDLSPSERAKWLNDQTRKMSCGKCGGKK